LNKREEKMVHLVLTPAAGKRLIAKAIAIRPDIKQALQSGTVAIVAGTTNGYVAEEILMSINQAEGFSKESFFRGVTMPPSKPADGTGKAAGCRVFPGDVVIVKGRWQKGRTIFDVADEMKEGDIILKGANALDMAGRRAAVLIGDPRGGTIIEAIRAVVGKRTRLIIPVGLEKRVSSSLDELALKVNAPGVKGPRLLPVTGEVITELEAVSILSGTSAELFAAGGVCGAEGTVWLAVSGEKAKERKIREIADFVSNEPAFSA